MNNYKNLLLALGASTLSLVSAASAADTGKTIHYEPMRVTVECKLTANSDEAQCGSFQVPEGQRFTAQRFSMRLSRPASAANRYTSEFKEGSKVWRIETPLAGTNARSQVYNLRRPVAVGANETVSVKLNRTPIQAAAPTAERVWIEFDGFSTQR